MTTKITVWVSSNGVKVEESWEGVDLRFRVRWWSGALVVSCHEKRPHNLAIYPEGMWGRVAVDQLPGPTHTPNPRKAA